MTRQTQASDPFYHTTRWRKLRALVLRRDGYQCQLTKRVQLVPRTAECVHHIFPREWWPEYQYASWNLISLCNQQHQTLHDRETNRLTMAGMDLLIRTARKRGMDLERELQKYHAETPIPPGGIRGRR